MNVLLLLVFGIYSGFAIMAVEMTIFCQCRTCMYRGSVHVCSSTIGVHTRTDPPYQFSRCRVKKKRHLNYLFVMTIQLLLFTLPSIILFFVKLLWIRSLSWSLLFATFGHWLHWYHETDGSIPIQSVSICVDKNHPLYYFILWQWYEWYSGVIWHDFVWC